METLNIKTKAELFEFIDEHFDSFTSEQITEIIYNATGNYVRCINFVNVEPVTLKKTIIVQAKKWTRELMKRWIDYYLQPGKRNKGIEMLNVYDV